jgi:transposase
VTLFFHKLRVLIYEHSDEYIDFSGEIELDESYFGGVRKGKRGRVAAGKVPVFGILKRGGKVYTSVINNTKKENLYPIIKEKIMPVTALFILIVTAYMSLHHYIEECFICLCKLLYMH